ncbi:SDR family oxidoreductase [Shewanella cyperi]|uniref:SDR family oxidoreductase n=1 Tax=Shewanella cyperi TaxID=2814292 RepID=A0A974XHN7_9GAMM|nr:SDR family oxidoreductase [Shewanella cyperi]QSX28597.1 SDR family oxidoreductase [Shewanella cyperi]QSX39341.1 SDR family oxidoreductase [Shewanella cyperi]
MHHSVLITGANRGIGLALTRVYLEAGSDVIACCRHPYDAKELQSLLDEHEGLEVFELDVTSAESIAALAEDLVGRPLNLIINNAGVYGPNGVCIGNTPAAEWLKVFEVNSIAPMKMVEALLPNLMAARGTVANMSSKMGSMADNDSGRAYIYRSSKAALNAVTKSLAIDLTDKGIIAVALHPGWVQTEMGGPNAPLESKASAAGLKRLLDGLSLVDSGGFYDFQGNKVPW